MIDFVYDEWVLKIKDRFKFTVEEILEGRRIGLAQVINLLHKEKFHVQYKKCRIYVQRRKVNGNAKCIGLWKTEKDSLERQDSVTIKNLYTLLHEGHICGDYVDVPLTRQLTPII